MAAWAQVSIDIVSHLVVDRSFFLLAWRRLARLCGSRRSASLFRHSAFYLVIDAFRLVRCAFGRAPPTTGPGEFVGFHVSMDVGGRLSEHKLVAVRPPNMHEMTPRTLGVLSSSRSMLVRTVARFTVQGIGGYRHVFIV